MSFNKKIIFLLQFCYDFCYCLNKLISKLDLFLLIAS